MCNQLIKFIKVHFGSGGGRLLIDPVNVVAPNRVVDLEIALTSDPRLTELLDSGGERIAFNDIADLNLA